MPQICHSKPQNMKKLFLFSFFGILIFCSCNYVGGGKRVEGNGNVISQDRPTGKFHSIDVSGAINVYVKQDSQETVKVQADANLQELIEVREENGVLYISPRDNFNLDPSNDVIKVYVTAPLYRSLHVSGASNIFGENKLSSSETLDLDVTGASEIKLEVKAPRINADLTGASSVTVAGETRDFNLQGSGASQVNCFDLLTENTTVDISGAFSAEVNASVKLDVSASGASEIKYKGSPAVTQDLSGASNVNKVN